MFKKKFVKKFSKPSKWPLSGLYKALTRVLRVFPDIISSVTDSKYPQLVERSGIVLKLKELWMQADTHYTDFYSMPSHGYINWI